ncbi:MAG TPA: hypothetical protein VK084_07435, partial [Chitinophagaceae bacterium]|nr:hypothetical protein [Chitinophagaceae bacterium]
YKAMQKGDEATARELQAVSDSLGKLYQENRLLPDSLSALKVLLHSLNECDKYVLPPLQKLLEKDEEETVERFQQYYANYKKKLN